MQPLIYGVLFQNSLYSLTTMVSITLNRWHYHKVIRRTIVTTPTNVLSRTGRPIVSCLTCVSKMVQGQKWGPYYDNRHLAAARQRGCRCILSLSLTFLRYITPEGSCDDFQLASFEQSTRCSKWQKGFQAQAFPSLGYLAQVAQMIFFCDFCSTRLNSSKNN